jgi:uroporphyrinogen decarboxylase
MDIEELARLYKGKTSFWGELDRQQIMPFGKPQDVRNAVMRVRKALDDGKGGVWASFEWGAVVPLENIRAAYQAWLQPIP